MKAPPFPFLDAEADEQIRRALQAEMRRRKLEVPAGGRRESLGRADLVKLLPPAVRQAGLEVVLEVERRDGQPRFGAWIQAARPEFRWDARHFRFMQDVLDQVTAGVLSRVLFQVSVRHGKTENMISYGAYRLHRDPAARILIATYGQPQARKLSRSIRKLARAVGVGMNPEVTGVDEWETAAGGGIRAFGSGSGVASVNADLIVIDDPVGSRAEAESAAHRERVWDWITNDLLARAEPHTQVLFSMPRWHEDDPSGRLQDQQRGRWHVIDLPGLSLGEGDALGRAEGELLWAEERPAGWIRQMREELGSYGFESLVQCRPRPREGALFEWDWFRLLEGIPRDGRMVRYWDLAGTQPRRGLNDPDYSAGVLLCRMAGGHTAIVDVARFRLGVAARDARVREVCREDLARYGGRIVWWIETEAGIQGRERTDGLKRDLQNMGMPVYDEHPTGSKLHRAEPFAAAAEAGNVFLCPGPWRDAFRLEACSFTGAGAGKDDQIDGASGAYAKLGPGGGAGLITQGTARL